jgi:hypothetical protein
MSTSFSPQKGIKSRLQEPKLIGLQLLYEPIKPIIDAPTLVRIKGLTLGELCLTTGGYTGPTQSIDS